MMHTIEVTEQRNFHELLSMDLDEIRRQIDVITSEDPTDHLTAQLIKCRLIHMKAFLIAADHYQIMVKGEGEPFAVKITPTTKDTP